MKQLIVLDKKIANDPEHMKYLMSALELEKEDFKSIDIEIKNDFQEKDLYYIDWVKTNENYYRPSFRWVDVNTQGKQGYHTVAFVIDESNWSFQGENKKIGGWQLGEYNGVYVQIIRSKKNWYYMSPTGRKPVVYTALIEEVMHFLDDIIRRDLKISLDKKYGFDFDEMVVHAKHPNYKRWQYKKALKELKQLLLKIFKNMYDLFRDPENPKEVYAFKNGVKRHIVNLYTLREGKGVDWEYKDEISIPVANEQEFKNAEERDEIVFTPND
ncbi:hypothetical protein [Persephonella sp.]